MPDKAFKRELDQVLVGCKYRKNKTCSWKGPVKDYQVYKSKFVIIYLCIPFFLKLHIDQTHVHYICPECNENFFSQAALDEHLKICPEIFQQCKLGSVCAEDMVKKIFFFFLFLNKFFLLFCN